MATPTPDQLGIFYTSKDLTTTGAVLPDRVIGSGATLTSLPIPTLNEATDFWNGAIGFFVGTGTTAALRGVTFHVRSWDNAGKRLALAQPLPIVPAAGDMVRLVQSGRTASNHEVLNMKVSGKQPEIEGVAGTNVTGVTIKRASALLGEGTLTLTYTYSTRTLAIRMGSGNNGPEVTLTGNAINLPIYNSDLSGYILVDVVYSSLATANRTDTFTLAAPKGNLIPNYEGYETNDGVGRTRYHLVVAKNKATVVQDAMNAFSIWTGKPPGSTTTTTATSSPSYTAPASIAVSNASTWPTRGFWIRNRAANAGAGDLRYVDYRSGNTLYIKAINWGWVNFTSGSIELKPGMTIGGQYSESAVIDQVILTSGTWTGGTAAGTLILKKFTGDYANARQIHYEGVQAATSAGASVKGYRGLPTVSWSSNQMVEPISDIDIGINQPSAGFYKNPENENIAPEGVTFGLYPSQEECLITDSLLGGDSVGIWIRQTILDGTQARQSIEGDLNFCYF
ncbi:MAG: hypothetical protein FWH27_14900 [Planctomycetaceae bacterium]|nr:hypothetical protein [Planctomycetaceae bacterium]